MKGNFCAGFSWGMLIGSHLLALLLIAGAVIHRDGFVAVFLILALLCFWVGRVTKGPG